MTMMEYAWEAPGKIKRTKDADRICGWVCVLLLLDEASSWGMVGVGRRNVDCVRRSDVLRVGRAIVLSGQNGFWSLLCGFDEERDDPYADDEGEKGTHGLRYRWELGLPRL